MPVHRLGLPVGFLAGIKGEAAGFFLIAGGTAGITFAALGLIDPLAGFTPLSCPSSVERGVSALALALLEFVALVLGSLCGVAVSLASVMETSSCWPPADLP